MRRQANRASLICEGARDGLSNPVGGISAESVTLVGVELLYRTDQPDIAFLNQVGQWDTAHAVLFGDAYDQPLTAEFKSLLTTRLAVFDDTHILHAPATSAEQLLAQLAGTDIVVATRFHNILLALLLNKPVISISFHHKCASLMEEMGLSAYCHDINHMDAGRLIEQFQDLERNADKLKPLIRQRVEQSRKALDEQYSLIFKGV